MGHCSIGIVDSFTCLHHFVISGDNVPFVILLLGLCLPLCFWPPFSVTSESRVRAYYYLHATEAGCGEPGSRLELDIERRGRREQGVSRAAASLQDYLGTSGDGSNGGLP